MRSSVNAKVFIRVLGGNLGPFEENDMVTFRFGAVFHRGLAISSDCVFGEIATAENVI